MNQHIFGSTMHRLNCRAVSCLVACRMLHSCCCSSRITTSKNYDHRPTPDSVRYLVPELGANHSKGDHGRSLVVGGCNMYTGAPYYASTASLLAGGDLATVFCSYSAAIPIKSYSPELLVLPSFKENGTVWLPSDNHSRFVKGSTAVVLGPGLGRSKGAVECARRVIELALHFKVPLVIDADGLWVIEQDMEQPSVIDSKETMANDSPLAPKEPDHWSDRSKILSYILNAESPVVLTPNGKELRRLQEATDRLVRHAVGYLPFSSNLEVTAGTLAVLAKGPTDRVCVLASGPGHTAEGRIAAGHSSDAGSRQPSLPRLLAWQQLLKAASYDAEYTDERSSSNGHIVAENVREPKGGLKRVGGQGDILSGVLATFLGWAQSTTRSGSGGTGESGSKYCSKSQLVRDACMGASTVTRKASQLAFERRGRSTTAPDVLGEVGPAMLELFDSKI